jgi:hypothetical protein
MPRGSRPRWERIIETSWKYNCLLTVINGFSLLGNWGFAPVMLYGTFLAQHLPDFCLPYFVLHSIISGWQTYNWQLQNDTISMQLIWNMPWNNGLLQEVPGKIRVKFLAQKCRSAFSDGWPQLSSTKSGLTEIFNTTFACVTFRYQA